MPDKPKNHHAGHRQRVKEEFLARGIEGWPDHRVLELMLFYALPQGDVNPLAHELIDRFGSLAGVLDALPEELQSVKGVGEHAAILLKLFVEVDRRYTAQRAMPGTLVHTVEEAGQILRPYFVGARNEMVYVLCLDSKEKVLGVRKVSEGSLSVSEVNVRRVAEICLSLRASYFYLAHNHTSNLAMPSRDDWYTTDAVRAALEQVGVGMRDHLIFVDGDMVSLKQTERSRGRQYYQLERPGDWE